MIQILMPARAPTPTGGRDRLGLFVDRIAAGDRAAFRCLYAFLAMPVWREAVRSLPCPADARAVTRSTFVEVWHLAEYHTDHSRNDTRAWIAAITAGRVGDRLRVPNAPDTILADYDRHVHRELVALLGAGRATIRTGPATFTRVDDLDLGF